jgi:arginyl-tRNA synthetase
MSTTEIKTQIAEVISTASGVPAKELVGWFEIPKNPQHGDTAFPCFRLAKFMRMAPPQIAIDLAAKLGSRVLPGGSFTIRPVGSYLNVIFDTGSVIIEILKRVLTEGASYGSNSSGAGQTVVLEYSSVNIAKPFGIGHLRSTIIGAALNRMYQKQGCRTISINHLGDWGTQFGNLIAAYKRWGSEYTFAGNPIKDLYALYVRFHDVAKDDPTFEQQGRDEFRKLEQGDSENLALWQRFIDYSMQDFNRVYKLLNVKFDHLTGESFYRDKMDAVIRELEDKQLLSQSEGATIVDLSAYDLTPCLIKKSDESTLYATRDLTALLYRRQIYNFNKILYIVGTAQKLHFQQFFKVTELMGYDWVKDQAVHVDFGWVKFGGEMMSTRAGKVVFFDDVLERAQSLAREIITRENPDVANVDWTAEKVAVAAVVFTQLRVRRNKDVNFIWEEALSFKGETGPYLQYTHARLSSLIQKYGKPLPDLGADFGLLGEDEKEVIKLYELYEAKITRGAEEYETLILADYLLELASAFNSYWQSIRIITDDVELTRARMQMAFATRTIIADGLRLLGIEPLERM